MAISSGNGTPSAMTTLNTYGHMWPDADESARTAVDEVLTARRNAAKKKR